MMMIPRTENLFGSFFDDFTRPVPTMRTDITETQTGYDMEIELPGYNKDGISVELKNGYMTVSAKSETEENTEEKKGYIRRERRVGSCSRTFYVGEAIGVEDIRAKFDNGVLRLNIPKPETLNRPETRKLVAIEG